MTRFPAFDLVLDQALEALAAGQSPADIAARYAPPAYPPAYAADLLPMLEAAQQAAAGFGGRVPAPDLARGRRRFLAAAAAPVARPRITPALVFGALVLVLGLLLIAPRASAAALPGEALYPVKRAVENVQLALTLAPGDRLALSDQLADRRRQEAARLLALGREARLVFEGRVEAAAPERLVISGLTVFSPDAAAFQLGDRVAVQARTTRAGSLIATRLTLLAAAPVTSTPPRREPTFTATPQRPRPTPTPSQPAAITPSRPAVTRTATAQATRPIASPASRTSPAATVPPATRSAATQRPPDPSATSQRPEIPRPTEPPRGRP